MSLVITNLDTGEDAAMLGDAGIELAKRIADRLAKESGGRWGVTRTEIVYETTGSKPDAADADV